jgi:hypothetical protein
VPGSRPPVDAVRGDLDVAVPEHDEPARGIDDRPPDPRAGEDRSPSVAGSSRNETVVEERRCTGRRIDQRPETRLPRIRPPTQAENTER